MRCDWNSRVLPQKDEGVAVMEKLKFIRKTSPTLEEMHRDFEINCLPTDLPRIQSVEMKKAFMSGVASLFHVMKFDIPEVSDDEGCWYLNRLDANLVEYFTQTIFDPPKQP